MSSCFIREKENLLTGMELRGWKVTVWGEGYSKVKAL